MKSIRLSHLVVIAFAIGLLLTVPTDGSAKWWDKFGEPQYGGTITFRLDQLGGYFDPYYYAPGDIIYWLESIILYDWTIAPETCDFKEDFIPLKYYTGLLAESWEMSDSQTMKVYIRKGIKWQNKPPVNGREFTAYDVQYHYHRCMGIGSGFTEPGPQYPRSLSLLESVTATDNHTVIFKFKKPIITAVYQLLTRDPTNGIEASESVEAGGGTITDWKNAVGTGAWMLSDWTAGSSVNFSRNLDYWGYDKRNPQNQLPYADTLRGLLIPDIATALAACRTGKLDILSNINWQQAKSLSQTNPELLQEDLPSSGFAVIMRADKAPFTDIRVRKALQLAIDRPTIW